MQENFGHYSVLLSECIENLCIKSDGTYVDCTLGGAGHSNAILSRLSEKGRLFGIDRDDFALTKASERLKKYGDRVTLLKGNFVDGAKMLEDRGIESVDGVIADLGVSSFQLDDASRGFSYMHDAVLDMRMDRNDSFSAYDVVNGYDEKKLCKIIEMYGEERFASSIARKICYKRQEKPIETTFELSDIIKSAIPSKNKIDGPHPAKRTFQALQIEVNRELDVLAEAIEKTIKLLKPQGRLCIITFHSLEEKLVKQLFKEAERPCTCPPDFPVCVCGKKSLGKAVTSKPILPTENECIVNPRSKSAKLRIFERK